MFLVADTVKHLQSAQANDGKKHVSLQYLHSSSSTERLLTYEPVSFEGLRHIGRW